MLSRGLDLGYSMHAVLECWLGCEDPCCAACAGRRQWQARCIYITFSRLQPPAPPLQATMKSIIKQAAREVYEQDLEQFVFGHPAQVALLGLQMMWTGDTGVRPRWWGQGGGGWFC